MHFQAPSQVPHSASIVSNQAANLYPYYNHRKTVTHTGHNSSQFVDDSH